MLMCVCIYTINNNTYYICITISINIVTAITNMAITIVIINIIDITNTSITTIISTIHMDVFACSDLL